jgi:hypothetical protein
VGFDKINADSLPFWEWASKGLEAYCHDRPSSMFKKPLGSLKTSGIRFYD